MPLIGAALVQMVNSPESLSYAFPESPHSSTSQVKNEFPHRSPGPASAMTPTELETPGQSHGQDQARRGSKKPRSIASMTQEQRDRKRENGEDP